VAGTADRVRDAEARIAYLRRAVGEAVGDLEVVLADLKQARAADRVSARLEPAREIGGQPPVHARDRMRERVARLAGDVADERVDHLRGFEQAEVDEADREQAVER